MRTTSTLSLGVVVCFALACVSDPKPAPAPAASSAEVAHVSQSVTTPAPPVVAPPSGPSGPSGSDRDPFAQQAAPKVAPPRSDIDLARKAKKYNVEQLRLVGIVSGEEQRAMFVDPRGKGWIVERGDRVGRAELHVDHFTGWRVDRIRSEEVVLIREDATRTNEAAETRVLALHTTPEPEDVED